MKAAFTGSGLKGLTEAVRKVEARLSGIPRAERTVLRVLSIDPGKVTGVAVYWAMRGGKGRAAGTGPWRVVAWAETLLAHDENQQVRDLLSVAERLVSCGPLDVVLEDFVVRRVAMEETFLSPVRIGRKVEWGLIERSEQWLNGVAVQWVFSPEMSAMTDARLKALGHYTPGPDHRRDATRHALLHLRALSAGNAKRVSTAELVARKGGGAAVWGSNFSGGTVLNGVRLRSER